MQTTRAGGGLQVLSALPPACLHESTASNPIPSYVNYHNRLIATVALLGVMAVPGSVINAQSVDATVLPALPTVVGAPAAAGSASPFAGISASLQAFRDSLVSRARAQIGTRYKLGGTAPERGFDCSGLVRFVANAFDIKLPRTARQQATMGVAIPKDLAAMKPGDLLTFGRGSIISHIGIYVGEGRFVHASTSQHKVIETSLVGTRSPLIKQWKGVRRMAEGNTIKMRDSLLAMIDSLP